MHSRRPNKDIENFMNIFFRRHIRKQNEKYLLCCLAKKADNELVPQSRTILVTMYYCGYVGV